MVYFSENLKFLRGIKKLSQSELAGELNVKKHNIGSWEEGRGTPNAELLVQVANFFCLSVDDLLTKAVSLEIGKKGYDDKMSPAWKRESVKTEYSQDKKVKQAYSPMIGECKLCQEKDQRIQKLEKNTRELEKEIEMLKNDKLELIRDKADLRFTIEALKTKAGPGD